MQLTNALIYATALLAVGAFSADICPPNAALIGQACPYTPNGPHICGASNKSNVVSTGLFALLICFPTMNNTFDAG